MLFSLGSKKQKDHAKNHLANYVSYKGHKTSSITFCSGLESNDNLKNLKS